MDQPEAVDRSIGEPRRITVKPGHVLVGWVRNGFVHVTDIIHGGISEAALTGSPPDLTPIPVASLEEIRRKHGLVDPIEDDQP